MERDSKGVQSRKRKRDSRGEGRFWRAGEGLSDLGEPVPRRTPWPPLWPPRCDRCAGRHAPPNLSLRRPNSRPNCGNRPDFGLDFGRSDGGGLRLDTLGPCSRGRGSVPIERMPPSLKAPGTFTVDRSGRATSRRDGGRGRAGAREVQPLGPLDSACDPRAATDRQRKGASPLAPMRSPPDWQHRTPGRQRAAPNRQALGIEPRAHRQRFSPSQYGANGGPRGLSRGEDCARPQRLVGPAFGNVSRA